MILWAASRNRGLRVEAVAQPRMILLHDQWRTFPSTHDELLTSGAKIEKLIVAHPALDRPVEVQILYIAYEGWIYSGR